MTAPRPSFAGARRLVHVAAVGALVALAACGPAEPRARELRLMSGTYLFNISASDLPPHAREGILYKIVVRDKESRQPIENGEGQLFAGKPIDPDVPSGPQSRTYDGFAYGPEVGVYHAKLNFVIPGTWAIAIRFRRDSLHPLERIDWMQDVINERPSNIP